MSAVAGIPDGGFLRVSDIVSVPAKNGKPAKIGLIPVSRAHWYAGVKSGRYPAPTKALGKHISAWSVASIRALIETASAKAGES